LGAICTGIVWFSINQYQNKIAGIKNDGIQFRSLTSRGFLAWILGIFLTGFYIVLYFYPQYLGLTAEGESNKGLVALFDPLSNLVVGNPASQWCVYGTFYTIAVVFFGVKFIYKYRHNHYQRLRTFSVMFFQLGFAFLIPEFMMRLNSDSFALPYYDLKNI